MYPDKIARVLDAVARADSPVLIHCAGGRDRTGMVGSLLLLVTGSWVLAAHQEWTPDELDAALDDRRPTLLDWVETFDAPGYLEGAGVDEDARRRLEVLLVE